MTREHHRSSATNLDPVYWDAALADIVRRLALWPGVPARPGRLRRAWAWGWRFLVPLVLLACVAAWVSTVLCNAGGYGLGPWEVGSHQVAMDLDHHRLSIFLHDLRPSAPPGVAEQAEGPGDAVLYNKWGAWDYLILVHEWYTPLVHPVGMWGRQMTYAVLMERLCLPAFGVLFFLCLLPPTWMVCSEWVRGIRRLASAVGSAVRAAVLRSSPPTRRGFDVIQHK